MTSRSDQARLETVQQLLYHLRSERDESEYLLKEVWESQPRSQHATVLDELNQVIAYLEQREKVLS